MRRIRKWLVSSAKYAQHRRKTHSYGSFNFLFMLLSVPRPPTLFVFFFPDVSVSSSREIRVAQHFSPLPPPLRLPSFSPPRPAGLDLAMKLQKREPAVATRDSDGYDILAIRLNERVALDFTVNQLIPEVFSRGKIQ